MTSNGFSIFQINLKDGRRPDFLNFNAKSQLADNDTALDDVVHSLESWGDSIYFGGFTIPRDKDALRAMTVLNPNLKSERALRFREIALRNGGRLDFQIEYGTPGSHEFAMASTVSANVPLTDKAPGHLYRSTLLPTKQRTVAFLVGQVRGRTIPALNALKMSSIAMKRDLINANADDKARIWTFEPKRVPFIGRLHEIIRSGQVEKVELVKYGVATSGKRRPPKEVVVTQKGLAQTNLQKVKDWMLGWLQEDEKSLLDPKNRKRELGLVNGMLEVDVTPEDYDEVGFIMKGADGNSYTVSPSSIADIYIFPTPNDEPVTSYDELVDHARPHIERLAKTLQVDLE